MQLREKVRVLQDQLDLQFAALDCYKAVAESLPDGLTLESLQFDGRLRKLSIFGTASTDDSAKVTDFNQQLRKASVKDQPLFTKVNPPFTGVAQGNLIRWNFSCELKRSDTE
jgi:hypothetical protein